MAGRLTKMKTLLRGGPLDEKVIQTDRNQFGYNEVTIVQNVGDKPIHPSELPKDEMDIAYWFSNREKHPAMKRGEIRVFTWGPRRSR